MGLILEGCRFCTLPETEIVHSRPNAVVIVPYGLPNELLIVPRFHAVTLGDLTAGFWRDAVALDDYLTTTEEPADGTSGEDQHARNWSINIGKLAGQTISHLHLWRTRRYANLPSSGKGLVTLRNTFDA